jgi:hypothetical protein
VDGGAISVENAVFRKQDASSFKKMFIAATLGKGKTNENVFYLPFEFIYSIYNQLKSYLGSLNTQNSSKIPGNLHPFKSKIHKPKYVFLLKYL